MGKTISDRIVNKVTGRNIKTIYVPMEEIVDMLDKIFIQPASREEYPMIRKVIKGGWLLERNLESKDGNYQLHVATHKNVGIFNLKGHNRMWIWDKSTDKYYEYRAFFWGKLKKAVQEKLN